MLVILDPSFALQDSALYGAGRKESSGTGLGAVRQSVRRAIHFFVNFEVFKSLYLSKNLPKHQTWGFCESRRAFSDFVDQ